jgi:AcrR family transcriptional regulator
MQPKSEESSPPQPLEQSLDLQVELQTEHRLPRADAVKNRHALLETARRLFVEQGVEVVTMTHIAESAGVGKGTLYRHFENKAALCIALLDDDQRNLQQQTLQRLAQTDTPAEKLGWFVRAVVDFVARNEAIIAVSDGNILTNATHAPAHWWWWQTIYGLLRQTGLQADLHYLSDMFYALLDARLIYFQRHVRGYSSERIAKGLEHMIDKLLARP